MRRGAASELTIWFGLCVPCLATGVALTAAATRQIGQSDEGRVAIGAFLDAYRLDRGFSVSWRQAETHGGDRAALAERSAALADIVPVPDPGGSGELWMLREGDTGFADDGSLVIRSWLMERRDRVAESAKVEIFADGDYILIQPTQGGVRGEAELIVGDPLTTSDIVSRRERRDISSAGIAATREYVGALLYAITTLGTVGDVRSTRLDEEWFDLSSESVGLSCEVNAVSGRCRRIQFRPPTGSPIEWRVIDEHDTSAFPASFPSIVRREVSVFGTLRVDLFYYDVPEMVSPTRDAFRWQSYRDVAFDRVRKVRIDASSGEESAGEHAIDRSGPEIMPLLRRVREADDAPKDANPPMLAKGRSLTWLWVVVGGLLVGSAGVLAWRRRGI